MRSTIDRLLAGLGIAMTVLLLVAGMLLTWASSFVGNQVNTQLSQQNITMPTDQTGLSKLTDAADRAALEPYAGQPMTTGDQAQAYANHFIAAHLKEMAGGQTFSQVSGAAQAACPAAGSTATPSAECTALRTKANSLFEGSTLRGLLLNAYAFGTMGKIAGYAAIASFVGALVFLILGILGFRHAARVSAAQRGEYVPGLNPTGSTATP